MPNFYTYSIQFKPTCQIYYGSKTSQFADPDQLFNPHHSHPYYTSSKLVKSLIGVYGLDAFTAKIRRVFTSREMCLSWERRFLARCNVETNPQFLNLDSKQQSYKAIQNNVQTKFISNPTTMECIRIPVNKPVPPGWTEGNVNNKGSPSKGRVWIHCISTAKSKMVPIDTPIPQGWCVGRPPEIGSKHSNTLRACNRHYYNNGTDCILLCDGEMVPSGFVPGRVFKNKPTGKKHHKYVWITDGSTDQQIPQNSSIPHGFKPGRSQRLLGENNPSSKRVVYNDVIYPSLRDCVRSTGISRHLLLRNGLVYYDAICRAVSMAFTLRLDPAPYQALDKRLSTDRPIT